MTDPPNLGALSITEPEGAWLVTTLSGTSYVIDFGNGTALRRPDPNDEDDEKTLRRDDEARPLLGCGPIAIGSDMVLILDIRGDGIPTRRWTTPVIRIERLA